MISQKLQTIGITVLATTVGFTSLFSVNTAVAREKIIFVPPVLGSPRRLIPAGTRAYEPPSGGNININIDILQTQPAPIVPPTRGFGGNGGNIVVPPIKKTIPPNQNSNGASVAVPNQCLSGKIPLTALIPESQLGLTTLSNPALFFYVPQTSAPELELVVQNETEQEVYTQKYKPNNKAGIISIRLPVNSLEVNKQYKWKLSVICNPTDKSQNKVVAGLVQRVSPDSQLVKRLQQATRQERAMVYAAAGIWHDALATVAQRRYLIPYNPEIASDWEELLTAKGVSLNRQIVQQPLIPSPEVLQPKNK
ncbi:DUF928 domain-containing protein [Nostoc sp. LEGE 06077]|uniref:DUF928 domain-containing protein n=1 Tax=Nostoc sp. LEGE 06077 TaxID=915325 RepID=UPI001882B1B7|nr:DUF928 domain-containing protein [Nostoc sp. LEGE 06077]MBE9205223.1 DUF928 domain-containing protein [Nostoc sp. LEGE 06077]